MRPVTMAWDINRGEEFCGMQYQTRFGLCYLLSGPDGGFDNHGVRWALFEVDEGSKPLRPVAGLHESVLGLDPTGREMRSRSPKP